MGLDFIKINPKEDERLLIEKYEKETDSILSNAQDARILIQLMVYYANLIKIQANEAANLNLVEFSRYPFIDFIGKMKNCPRLTAKQGEDVLLIKLNTTFSYDLTITRGFQVKTNDGLHIFETTTDLIIPAGEVQGLVNIQSQEAISEINKYKAGEINTVISSSFSFIESVTNINGVSGGSDDETDESYAQRILLAPEGFSVAGPELAYIYWTLSSHPSIVDASVDIPQKNAQIDVNGTLAEMSVNTIENDVFNAKVNYQTGEIEIELKQDLASGSKIKTIMPHPYEIDIYALTTDGEASQSVLDDITETLKPVRPISDYVVTKSAQVKEYSISGTVYLKKDADETVTKAAVKTVLNSFVNEFKNKLNRTIVLNQIIAKVNSVDGVFDFKPTSPTSDLLAEKQVYYSGSIDSLTWERMTNE